LIEPIGRLAQNLYLAVSTPAQYAALASFSEENIAILEARRQTMRERRDFLVDELRRLGFRIPVVPEGAFYVYADCSGLCEDSMELCRSLLEDAGVAITPGIDFGVHRAREHVRFAYTTEIGKLREGMDRIARLLASRVLRRS
jgi:aspartate/methionine/tyrosine aminotransferase